MSERININDIQAFFRHDISAEDYFNTSNEKAAYKKYMDTYHKLLNANYRKRMHQDTLQARTRLKFHSQNETDSIIDDVKEIVELDKEIYQLESQLEDMEQSKLFQKIHHQAVYGVKRNLIVRAKESLSVFLKQKTSKRDLIKCIAYFLLLVWIDVIGNIVMDSYSGILTKIFFIVGIVILFFYIAFNYFLKDEE